MTGAADSSSVQHPASTEAAAPGSPAPHHQGERDMEKLFTVTEAADVLGTTPRFPRRLIAERRIRFVRLGRHVRIPESALIEYVTASTVDACRPVVRQYVGRAS